MFNAQTRHSGYGTIATVSDTILAKIMTKPSFQIIIITMGQEDSKLATGFSVFQLHIGYGYIDMLLIVSVQQLYGLKNHFYTGACTVVGTVYPVTLPRCHAP